MYQKNNPRSIANTAPQRACTLYTWRFYIKMELKCMYIQCMFIHGDSETVAITGRDEISRYWNV